MNILYNCKGVCPLGIEPCRNQGYRIPYDREKRTDECICVFLPGNRGELCEEELFDSSINNYDLEYYVGLRCGGEINESKTIRTYDYPFRSHKKPGCCWWLNPPSNHSISVEFMDFSFMQLDTNYNACVYERVEIRYDGPGRNKFDPKRKHSDTIFHYSTQPRIHSSHSLQLLSKLLACIGNQLESWHLLRS